MCGICGLATRGETPDRDLLRAMTRTIVHRGPDGEGFFAAPGIGLGMRRLAIIDVEGGQQPMGNETGSVQVIFNGEIYNFRELRRDLEARGHRFATSSDTEVLPHLYEEHGVGFATHLNGIFAVALWDAQLRRLVLVRDRIGVKPLFWSQRQGCLYFGSTVKCILAAGGSDREIDWTGLDQLLGFEYTASPTTLLRDVRKLAPGGWLTWEAGSIRSGSYWSADEAPPAEPRLTDDEWASRLRHVLDEAVRRQMVSDVPIGALLSGGIDSSAVVSAMSRAAARPVSTFSIGFAETSYDELPFARTVADRFGTDHHEAILTARYPGMVDEVIEHLDQPIADFSVFPTLLVSRVARGKVTVVLSGDGGDELFAGYDTYLADRVAHATLDRLPAAARRAAGWAAARIAPSNSKHGLRNVLGRFLEGAQLDPARQHTRWMTFLTPARARELYLPEVWRRVEDRAARLVAGCLDNSGEDRLQRQLLCDTRLYLPENILAKADLMGMAASLEIRVPFLDNEVVDLARRMPSRLKWGHGARKRVLRRAYASVLPPEILARKKQGFSIPLKTWLAREWNPLLHDVLAEEAVRRDGLFDATVVQRLIREHESGRSNHSHLLWALLVFQLWKSRFAAPSPQPARAAS